MITKNLPAMLTLAVLTAASFSATVVAQQTRISSTGFSKITVRKTEVPKRVPQAARNVTVSEANTIMAQYKQWMIGANNTGNVEHSLANGAFNYNLKGKVIRKFLQYEKQGTFGGINLGWTDNASASTATKRAKWFFSTSKPANISRPGIQYGRAIAISWGSGGRPYIKYSKRTIGINLDWSNRPSYEWVILGGQPGTPVKRGQDWVIIFNLKHRQPLMYFDRTVGGDIGWPDSRRWGLSGGFTSKNKDMPDAVTAMLLGNWKWFTQGAVR